MKTAHPLPIISNCDGCGACCREQESPPGYILLLCKPDAAWPDEEDIVRFKSLPPEAMQELIDHRDRLERREPRSNMACIWFDPTTRRCRWHEHRPQICRDFDVGSDGCRNWRKTFNVLPY